MTITKTREQNKLKENMKKKENLKNFITLTEIYLVKENQIKECAVSIKPSDIVCIKDVQSEKYQSVKASVFLNMFTNQCQGFNFDGPILVKETRDEIDEIITKFYENKRKKGSPPKKDGTPEEPMTEGIS